MQLRGSTIVIINSDISQVLKADKYLSRGTSFPEILKVNIDGIMSVDNNDDVAGSADQVE